jgi:DNA-binding response OmpR family regulator
MLRPALLIVEPEPDDGLSTRKLVLETAKFNVVTAHSTQEGVEAFAAFPNVSGAVVVASDHIDCGLLVPQLRQSAGGADLPIIALSPRIGFACEGADYVLPSREPDALLDLMRNLFGDPRLLETE